MRWHEAAIRGHLDPGAEEFHHVSFALVEDLHNGSWGVNCCSSTFGQGNRFFEFHGVEQLKLGHCCLLGRSG